MARRRRRSPSKRVVPHVDAGSGAPDASLLELVDHLLNQGVVLSGDIVLGLADVDLVYLRLCALICAADRVLPESKRRTRNRARH